MTLIERLRERARAYPGTTGVLLDEAADALEAQAKDAARWRYGVEDGLFPRKQEPSSTSETDVLWFYKGYLFNTPDAAIDAAMSKPPAGKEGA